MQHAAKRGESPQDAEIRKRLSDSEDLVRRYEKRYGKLLSQRPKHDFRELRPRLKGKSMDEVRAVLGKPSGVYTMGPNESWEYTDIAFDSSSGRTVRRMEIWFVKGVVDFLKASY